MSDVLDTKYYFVSGISHINKPEFIKDAKAAFDDAVEVVRPNHTDKTTCIQTENMLADKRIHQLSQYIVQSAFNILAAQGYKMDDKTTFFHSLWGQHHGKYASMPQHIHNDGVQIVGFYFLECPENGPDMIVYDPRPAKAQLAMPELDITKLTEATSTIVFKPAVGDLYFANAWLPHAFSINKTNKPFKLIHFNISVGHLSQAPKSQATVV